MQIGIWEERKVFGSRGQILKEEFIGKHDLKPLNAKPTNVKPMNVKLVMFLYLFVFIYILCMLIVSLIFMYLFFLLQRPSAGNALDKIVSGYHHIYAGQTDEDVVLSKCRNAISSLEKADKEIVHGSNSGMLNLIMVIVFPNCSNCDSSTSALCIQQT